MWKRIKKWWVAEGALVSLQSLDDRMLQDMGLQREGLADLVMGRDAVPVAPKRDMVGAKVQVACRC